MYSIRFSAFKQESSLFIPVYLISLLVVCMTTCLLNANFFLENFWRKIYIVLLHFTQTTCCTVKGKKNIKYKNFLIFFKWFFYYITYRKLQRKKKLFQIMLYTVVYVCILIWPESSNRFFWKLFLMWNLVIEPILLIDFVFRWTLRLS